MKYFFASALAAASLAAAQIDKLPPCSIACLTAAVTSSGCDIIDTKCQCTTAAEKIVKNVIPCLCASECNPDDITAALLASDQICVAAATVGNFEFHPVDRPKDICKAAKSGTHKSSPPGNAATPGPVHVPETAPPGSSTNETTTIPGEHHRHHHTPTPAASVPPKEESTPSNPPSSAQTTPASGGNTTQSAAAPVGYNADRALVIQAILAGLVALGLWAL